MIGLRVAETTVVSGFGFLGVDTAVEHQVAKLISHGTVAESLVVAHVAGAGVFLG